MYEYGNGYVRKYKDQRQKNQYYPSTNHFEDYRGIPSRTQNTFIPQNKKQNKVNSFSVKNDYGLASNNLNNNHNYHMGPTFQNYAPNQFQYYNEGNRTYNVTPNIKIETRPYNNPFGAGAITSFNDKNRFKANQTTQETFERKYVGDKNPSTQTQPKRSVNAKTNPVCRGSNKVPMDIKREGKMPQKKNDKKEQNYQRNIINNNVEGNRNRNEESNNIKQGRDNLEKNEKTEIAFEEHQGEINAQKGSKIPNDNTKTQINTNKNLLNNDINPSMHSEKNKESQQTEATINTTKTASKIQDDKPKVYSEIELKMLTSEEIQNIKNQIFFDTQNTFQLSSSIMNKNYNIEEEKIYEKLKQKYCEKISNNNFIYGQCDKLLNNLNNNKDIDFEKIKSFKANIYNLLNEKQETLEKEIKELTEKQKKAEEKFILYYEQKKRKGEIILRGLSNVGATCYMNSTLQCLSNVAPLTEYLLGKNKNSEINKKLSNKDNLICYYKEVIENLWAKNENSSSYAPKKFKEILSEKNELFKGIVANDSKDLILYLLETFHTELNTYKEKEKFQNNEDIDQTNDEKMFEGFKEEYLKKNISIISELFHGILKVKSVCNNCFRENYTYQSFNLLEFPLEEIVKFVENRQGTPYTIINNEKMPFLNLIECFEHYRAVTMFSGDNQMYCNGCFQNANAFYYNFIKKAPKILVIILNRGKAAKYNCLVNFGKKLNIEEYVEDKEGGNVYELIGVIVHYGPSSNCGHFIAFCINRTEQSWYKYNDAHAERCEFDNEYINGMPYILFYRKMKK